MKLYQLKYDDQFYYVEAESMRQAIDIWHAAVLKKWQDEPGSGWDGTEEPEGVTEIHDEPVIRA
jgi:hypothetical protein